MPVLPVEFEDSWVWLDPPELAEDVVLDALDEAVELGLEIAWFETPDPQLVWAAENPFCSDPNPLG